MKKILQIILIFLFSLTIISCSDEKEESSATGTTDNTTTTDTTAPVIAEVTAVTTPTIDTTPNYTFSSTEAGTITYGGSCSSNTSIAISGNNTITLNSLSDGTYSDCIIAVRGNTGYLSNILAITSFTVDTGVFVAVGASGTFLKSTDGTTWTEINTTYVDNGSSISSSFT